MPTTVSMAPLHSLGHDDGNEVQHDCIGHMMPLASASVSCNAGGIINSIIACAT